MLRAMKAGDCWLLLIGLVAKLYWELLQTESRGRDLQVLASLDLI